MCGMIDQDGRLTTWHKVDRFITFFFPTTLNDLVRIVEEELSDHLNADDEESPDDFTVHIQTRFLIWNICLKL